MGSLTDDYASLASSEGCEACHGAPYRKHGNIQAAVEGAPDFTYCKSCHFDDRSGGHEDWQWMVDDPAAWAPYVPTPGFAVPPELKATYAYAANVMNVTHMSHAMEFPYPMSMSNCSTCHTSQAQLDAVLDNSNFTAETCKSCHPVDGVDAWPAAVGDTEEGKYAQSHRAPPLAYLWAKSTFPSHTIEADCQACHGAGFSSFADLHSGYDDVIYDDNGVRYADQYTVQIEDITMAGTELTIDFTANNTDIVPQVMVSLYGWSSKNFYIASHDRDGSVLCGDRGCRMEFRPDDTNPLFTEDPASVPGDWSVTVDLAAYVPTAQLPKDIPTLIAEGDIKTAEVSIRPQLSLDGEAVALEGVSKTFDLGASMIVTNYFKDEAATVSVKKCNACHDLLGPTFHGTSGVGGDDIVICKNCHVTTEAGGHLELASRGIDSYVHAIHTFQPFDEDEVAEANDAVLTKRNEQHKHHTFPYFTATACEACHLEGTYNVPDQAASMPGVLSKSYDIPGRMIGAIPEYVTGPASRACGGCHRADMIVAGAASDLASFNAHTGAFGTLEENDANDLTLYGIIDKIMSYFQ